MSPPGGGLKRLVRCVMNRACQYRIKPQAGVEHAFRLNATNRLHLKRVSPRQVSSVRNTLGKKVALPLPCCLLIERFIRHFLCLDG